MSTRNAIISISKTLFNDKGYSNVSMRDISNALNISVGNLTYHFHLKVDIIKEIIDDTLKEMQFNDTYSNINDFNNYIKQIYIIFSKNSFLFNDYLLYKEENDIKEKVTDMLVKTKHNITNNLINLKNNNCLKEKLSDEELSFIASNIIIYLTSLQSIIPLNDMLTTNSITQFIDYLDLLLKPYLN